MHFIPCRFGSFPVVDLFFFRSYQLHLSYLISLPAVLKKIFACIIFRSDIIWEFDGRLKRSSAAALENVGQNDFFFFMCVCFASKSCMYFLLPSFPPFHSLIQTPRSRVRTEKSSQSHATHKNDLPQSQSQALLTPISSLKSNPKKKKQKIFSSFIITGCFGRSANDENGQRLLLLLPQQLSLCGQNCRRQR